MQIGQGYEYSGDFIISRSSSGDKSLHFSLTNATQMNRRPGRPAEPLAAARLPLHPLHPLRLPRQFLFLLHAAPNAPDKTPPADNFFNFGRRRFFCLLIQFIWIDSMEMCLTFELIWFFFKFNLRVHEGRWGLVLTCLEWKCISGEFVFIFSRRIEGVRRRAPWAPAAPEKKAKAFVCGFSSSQAVDEGENVFTWTRKICKKRPCLWEAYRGRVLRFHLRHRTAEYSALTQH